MRNQRSDEAQHHLDLAKSLPVLANWPASHQRRFFALVHSERFELARQLQDMERAKSALSDWLQWEPDNKALQEKLKQFEAAAANDRR